MYTEQLFFEIRWRLFYSLLTYFITLIVCIDSWEYLLNCETEFLLKNTLQFKNNFIFSQLLDGQKLIYLISFYYAFLFSGFFIILQIICFLLPGLYKIEILNFFFNIFFFFNFILSHLLTHYFFFPIICKDLLQYQYNNLGDRILNLNIEYLMNISDIVLLKLNISLLIGILLNICYLAYIYLLKKNYLFYNLIKYKKVIYFIWFFTIFLFFENDFYLTIFFYGLSLILFEYYFFLVLLLKKYLKLFEIR